MSEIQVWSKYKQDQLVLNLCELSKYFAFAQGGIQTTFLRKDGQLPTLLHSAGNALYTCSCGCGAALSDARLQARELVGALVPLNSSQIHMNIEMQHCRYLYPLEMRCFMGGLPNVSFGLNLRLAMRGIGQCVSPLVGLWIFGQIKHHIEGFLDLPRKLCPFDVLQAYVQEMRQKCAEVWPAPVPPTVVEEVIEDEAPFNRLLWPANGDHVTPVRCPVGTTGSQILAAEGHLGTLGFVCPCCHS